MSGPALLDSNILLYAFDAKVPEKQAIASGLVADAVEGRKRLFLGLQNVTEFLSNMLRKNQPVDDAQAIVSRLLEKFPYLPAPDHNSVEYAMRLVKLHNIPFWDALIAAIMLEHSVFTIYTEDEKDFSRIPGIKVINPFRKK